MKRAAALAVALFAVAAGAQSRTTSRFRTVPACIPPAAGEIAPTAACETSNTVGSAPATCACPATVTDGHGVPITTTRATSAQCAVSYASLSNGDVSTCTSGKPRTVAGAYLVEGARTNFAKDTTMNNGGAWSLWSSGGPAVPTKTALYATDPYGTASSAPRYQFPSCAAANARSIVYQPTIPSAGQVRGGVWVRSNVGSDQTVSVCVFDDGTLDGGCVAATVDAGTWTFVSPPAIPLWDTDVALSIGCENLGLIPGHSNTGAADVLLWGGQVENGAFVSSPITTPIPSTATRNADVVSEPMVLTSASAFSMAATYTPQVVPLTNATVLDVYVDANNYVIAYQTGAGKVLCDFHVGGAASTVTSTGALTAGVAQRVSCDYDGATKKVCLAGVCDTAAASLTLPKGAATLYVGTRSATGNEAWGLVGAFCASSTSLRCQ